MTRKLKIFDTTYVVKYAILFIILASIPTSIACDIAIETRTQKDLFDVGESIEYSHTISDKSFEYFITYWIEDSEGNVLKLARNTTNTNTKTYTPDSPGNIILKAELHVECNETDFSNNYYEKQISVVEVIENATTVSEEIEIKEEIILESNSSLEVNVSVNETTELNVSVEITNSTNESEIVVEDEINDSVANVSINESVNKTIVEPCQIEIDIEVSKTLIQNKEKLEYQHILNNPNVNYSIEYWIEDLFGNIVKEKRITYNTNTKLYTPTINEKDKTILLKTNVKSECGSASAEKQITIVNQNYEYVDYSKQTTPKSSSSSTPTTKPVTKTSPKPPELIKSLYTLTKKFEQGKEIKIFASVEEGAEVKVIIGNTTVNATIEDGKIVLNHNLTSGNNTIKLQILQEGTVIEEKTLSLYVDSIIEENTPFLAEKKETTESLKNKKELLETTKTYESDKEAGPIIKYIMLGISALLNVVLIWRR